jgi:ADP-heptose:LPS heptosyltransferase
MRKVLLVCLDNVGDLVFNSALTRALTRDPSVELSLLCKDYTQKLGTLMPGVQRTFAADPFWDKSPSRGKGRLWPFLRVIWSLRREKFETAYISSGDWHTPLALRLIGIKTVFALQGRKNKPFLTRALPMPSRQEPVVKGLLQSFADLLPKLSQDEDAFYQLDPHSLPAWTPPQTAVVVLHAFAGSPLRCAPLEIWEQLADDLEARGYFPIWTGNSQELQTLRQRFAERWSPDHYIDSWAHDLLTLAAVWRHARFFVGHDSGPLHVAHALSVPVLALFLPGEPLRTFPQGPVPYKMLHRANPAALRFEDVQDAVTALEAKLADGRKT